MAEEFDKFDLGFISEYDVDKTKLPKNALRDCLNMEINRPLLMLSGSLGYDTDQSDPSYSGSRNVAIRRWSVDQPSEQEITTLIKASENLLLYSEDFEMSSEWLFTAGGATLTANNAAGPTRMADRVTTPAATTKFEQSTLQPGNGGIQYTFSVYLKASGTGGATIQMEDEIAVFATNPITLLTGWNRFTVTGFSTALTNTVIVRVLFSAAYATADIWGAQLELGPTASGYGMTGRYIQPYYIFMRPYWDGSAWVDDWRELTEQRFGIVSGLVGATSFVVSGLDGADNYYNNWRALKASATGLPFYVYDYTASTQTLKTNNTSGIVNTDEVGIARFLSAFESPLLQQGSVVENNITFVEVHGELRISFGSTHNPLIIKYISITGGFNGLTNTIAYDEFVLCYTSHIGISVPTTLSLTASTGSEDCGVGLNSVTNSNGAGSLALGTYWIAVVMNIDNHRYLVTSQSTTLAGVEDTITVSVQIQDGYFNPRTTSIEVYVGTGSNDWELVIAQEKGVENATITWTYTAPYIRIDAIILNVPTVNPSLLQRLGRISVIESRSRFDIQHYIRGRRFIAGGQTSSDFARFSHIRAISELLDDFAISEGEGYGFIVAEAGSSERIIGYASTRDNDLMIFKDRSTLLYEVQSGSVYKRLVRVFDSVGLSTNRGIATSDYGTFWYDANGVYQYFGGVSTPRRIAESKIARYMQQVLATYLPTSFAHYNRALDEYWIFTQRSGSVGSTTVTDYIILRYSPKYNNWNILQLPFIPVWVSEKQNGELLMVGTTDAPRKYGYSAIPVSSGFVLTHPYPFGANGTPKQVSNIGLVYNVDANVKVSLIINEEAAARSGNAMQFLLARKQMVKQPRQATKFNRLSCKIEKTGGVLFSVHSTSVEIEQLPVRYAGR